MCEAELHVEIPNEASWPEKAIDDLCALISRGTAPVYVEQSDVYAIGQSCVASTGFLPEFARPHSSRAMSNVLRPESGDVLLNSTGTGTLGRSAVFDGQGNFIVDGHVTLMRPLADAADCGWLNPIIQSPWFQRHLERFCYSGSTNQLELGRTPLRVSCLPVPRLAEQKKIAQILDTLDTAIHETEAIIAKLQAVKQGLLHDLLTRGIGANGELRPPQAEAPQLYKQSPLGWIPKEWATSSVRAEFVIDAGITLGPSRAPKDHPRKYLRVANVRRGNLQLDDVAQLEATDEEAKSLALEPGDLLVVEGHASTSEIGRCAAADERVRGVLFQNHLFRLRPRTLLSPFALLVMNSEATQTYWRREAATSSGLNTINRTKLGRLQIATPDRSEQSKIVDCAAYAADRADRERQLRDKLLAQKTALMDDLLTGRVRVTPLLESAAA